MWDRITLKTRGKAAFLKNYWTCVAVAFVLSVLLGGSGSSIKNRYDERINNYTENYQEDFGNVEIVVGNNARISSLVSTIISVFASLFFLALMVIMIVLSIFVFSPLEVGGCRFFIENAYETGRFGNLAYAFGSGSYLKIVGTMFLRGLYIFLWSLLLFIPGIIKSYEYRMVPYLLAECPEMGSSEAFRISKEMMYGQKMEAFILDLSFIGWEILSACTCGLLGLFFVNPYKHATNAELFLELKRNYFGGQFQSSMY